MANKYIRNVRGYPHLTYLEEVARSRIQRLESSIVHGSNNSFTDVSIIRRSYYVHVKLKTFPSYQTTTKMSRFTVIIITIYIN